MVVETSGTPLPPMPLAAGSGSGSGAVPPQTPTAPLHGIKPPPPPPLWTPPDTPPGPSPSGTSTKVQRAQHGGMAPNYDMLHTNTRSLLKERRLEESPDSIDDAPDWAMGKGEQPAGIKHMGGWTMKVFTQEQ